MAVTTRIDVITGFLGAGKTTFLLRYCQWLRQQGITFAVIENEFGQAGVDASLLQSADIAAEEISGGCVCCTLKTVLYDKLCRLAGQVERIVIEPSGLFCGDDLMDILDTPGLQERLQPGMWLGIVDPMCLDVLRDEDRAVLADELVWSGSILLSKTQLCTSEELDMARTQLRNLLCPVPLLSDRPWDALDDDDFRQLQAAGTVRRAHERIQRDHTRQFQSAVLRVSGENADLRQLTQRLQELMDGGWGEILRVKGGVLLGGKPYLVNCTPRCVTVQPAAAGTEDRLNIIGRGLDRRGIRRYLEG